MLTEPIIDGLIKAGWKPESWKEWFRSWWFNL